MSILLIDKNDNEDTFVLERTEILNKNAESEPVNELEKTMHESTSDLSLGRALNLLVNIHGRIFDKAVHTIRESSSTELAIKRIEMPTVRAIISIENYLTASNDINSSFKHVYDSLHEKFIKRSKSNSNSEPAMRIIGYFILHSKYHKEIQQFICNELKGSDKRSQLAAVLLLQFLYTNYISRNLNYCDLSIVFIPPLVQISEKYSDSPTLLACSSCDLALQFIRYIALHTKNIDQPSATSKIIIELDKVVDNSNAVQQLSMVLEYAQTLFHIMEKWQKTTGQFETTSYKSMHQSIIYALKNMNELQPTIIDVLDLIISYLTPKSILTEKPLSTKKQKLILLYKSDSYQNVPLMSIIKIILIVLLQKGRLVELYGSKRASIIYSSEEEEIKDLFLKEYNLMVRSYNEYKEMSKDLILQMITQLSYLCKTIDIESEELIQAMINTVEYDQVTTGWMVGLCMKAPETSICNLLLRVMHEDDKSKSSYNLLGDLIAEGSTDFINILVPNLLSVIKSSNQACELLIQCMSYTHLPSLIQALMPMTIVDNEREKMTYIAMIAKALLHETWPSRSILLYIDMIKEFKFQKGFVAPAKTDFNTLLSLTPATIVDHKSRLKTINRVFNEQELEHICPPLMAPFQLWCTKIDGVMLRSALKQLVRKTYGIPTDSTCIETWKYLSFAFLNDHSLIWNVIEQCLDIMMNQIKNSQNITKEELFFKISPLLILQTIPIQAFDLVKLPKSYMDLLSNKFQKINVDPQTIKISTTAFEHTQLCIQLMEELLSRSLENGQLNGGLQNPIEFSISLLVKIFCK